jgi:hypothetical protein
MSVKDVMPTKRPELLQTLLVSLEENVMRKPKGQSTMNNPDLETLATLGTQNNKTQHDSENKKYVYYDYIHLYKLHNIHVNCTSNVVYRTDAPRFQRSLQSA